jgi:hypothetical protein
LLVDKLVVDKLVVDKLKVDDPASHQISQVFVGECPAVNIDSFMYIY